ncbi:MAG: type IV pilus modification PilV family protein [Candidatus Heimdallarchaeaceae archaeon]
MKNKGFSLIEVITAIFILTVGVGGAFSLIYQTLSAVYIVRSELMASFLAQEGVEVVKNLRDNAWLESRAATSTSWLTHLGSGDYRLDYLTQDLNTTYGGTYMKIDSNGFIGYSGDTTTNFTRKVSLTNVSTTTVGVVVTVEWQTGGRPHSLEVRENITNWYEK